MLELDDIQAGYGAVRVLDGVSVSLPEGQVVALVGRNGAGKTTTLRVASCMITPTRGTVHFDGERIDRGDPEDAARMGMAHVPEGRGVFPRFTVRENLEAGSYHRKLSRSVISDRITEVTETFPRLAERLNQRAGSLSGGEQQMLVIARALMSNPSVLLVDEPSLGLAPVIVDELYELLARLKGTGLTILLVEQYVELALALADYAYVLEKGRVTLEGKAHDLAKDRHLVDAYLSA